MLSRFFPLLPLAAIALGGCRPSSEEAAPVPVSSLPRHRRIAELEQANKAVLDAPVPELSELATSANPTFEAPSKDSAAGSYLTFLQGTKPRRSLLVLEPQNAKTDSFYAGCARWMRLYGAGSPAFDSGTTWGMPDDIRRARKWDSLALDQNRAAQLAHALDATCVAVGSLQQGKLLYQVFDVTVAPPRLVGTFSLSGTKAQMMAGLPKLTRQIAAAAGAPKITLPATVGLQDKDLALLGTLPFHDTLKTPFSGPQRAQLARLSDHPLAAMFVGRAGGDEKAIKRGANALLALSASNIAAGVELVNYWGTETPRLTAALHTLDTKYPRHFCVAIGNALLRAQEQDYFAQVHYAEMAVRSAPHSGFAWNQLSEAITNEADEKRQGKYYNEMTTDQKIQVEKMYPRALAAAWKATQLEPGDASYWTTLSSTAAFEGNSQWAQDALVKSLKIEPSNDNALSWGLQLFQPKWLGDATSYAKMARFAVENARGNDLNALGLCEGLDNTNQQSLKRPLLQILLRHEPNNVGALAKYSYALRMETGSSVTSYKLAKRAVQLAPDSVTALEELGDIEQHDRNEYAQAITHLQRAANLDPQTGVWWVNLALPYAKSGQLAKAKAVALKGRALGYTGPHPAWSLVGLSPDGSELKAGTKTNAPIRPASP